MNTQPYTPEGWNYNTNVLTRDVIYNAIDNKDVLQGIVNSCDENYNLHVSLGNGIDAIMPRNEIEAINANQDGCPRESLCTGKVNKFVQFRVKEMNEDGCVIISRKDVQKDALKWIKNDLQVGQKIQGIVKSIKPYGVFIEIGGGVVGLAHIEDLSVARIKSPSERVRIGQKIDVLVKSIDRNEGKVILTYKELLGTWEENVKNFKEKTHVKGIVRETK